MNLQDLDGNELGVIEVIENVKNDGDEGEGEEEIIYETVTEDVGVEGNVMTTSMDEPETSGTRNMSQNLHCNLQILFTYLGSESQYVYCIFGLRQCIL